MEWIATIGLEVHAQLSTTTKAWCSCEISPYALENTKVCEVCSGQPGTLPALNKRAVEFASKFAMATNSKINPVSFFDRKNSGKCQTRRFFKLYTGRINCCWFGVNQLGRHFLHL